MNHKLLVYISGPMSTKNGRLSEENVITGLKMHLELIKLGRPNFCPHLSGIFPSAWAEVKYSDWLEYDLAIMDHCTHVFMIKGWENSNGAKLERKYAIEHGIPVIYDINNLLSKE